MNSPSSGNDSLVLSYLSLRKAVGCLGIALPIVLAIGGILIEGTWLQESISYYYYTVMRNFFVGTLCSIAVFMLSYHGYERSDDIAGDLACVFALGVAFFPTTPHGTATGMQQLVGGIHLASAAAFFLTLSYFSLCLFTKTDPTKQATLRKTQRNKVYKACGYIMLGALGLILLHGVLPAHLTASLDKLDPIFWLESVAIIAFGISWLTKGEAILKDQT